MAIVLIEDKALQDAVAVLRAAKHPELTFIQVARVIKGLQQCKPQESEDNDKQGSGE